MKKGPSPAQQGGSAKKAAVSAMRRVLQRKPAGILFGLSELGRDAGYAPWAKKCGRGCASARSEVSSFRFPVICWLLLESYGWRTYNKRVVSLRVGDLKRSCGALCQKSEIGRAHV